VEQLMKSRVRDFSAGGVVRAAVGLADPTNAFTILGYVKPGASGEEMYFARVDSGNTNADGWNSLGFEGGLLASFPGPSSALAKPSSEHWCLAIAGKPAGSAKILYSVFDFTTGIWSHGESASATATAHAAAPARIQFGRWGLEADQFKGQMAAAGVWGVHMTKVEREALLTAFGGVKDWLSLSPLGLWTFDQEKTSELRDLTDHGADYLSQEKTVVAEAELPFPYGAKWKRKAWVDDDGSGTVGTAYTAARMENIEDGIEEGTSLSASAIASLAASGVGFVHHGSVAATVRPTGFKMVIWEGSVEPTNATAEDLVIYENSSALHVPAVRAYASSTVAIATGAVVPIPFNAERFDNSEIHSTSSNTTRLTAPKAGVYDIRGFVNFPANGTGERVLWIRLNGSEATRLILDSITGAALSAGGSVEVSTQYLLAAGDYVELCALQNSGATLTATAGANFTSSAEFGMVWLGSGLRASEPVDWGLVSALPAEAEVGDYCTFKAAAKVHWRLVKTNEDLTYPWEKIGGPPLVAELDTGVTGATQTAYTALACEVKTPLKGDYRVTISSAIATSAAGVSGFISYSVGATAASDADSATNSGGWANQQTRPNRLKAGLAAATALVLKYRVASGNGNFNFNSIAIDPERVG
jgi:hypothetical protein